MNEIETTSEVCDCGNDHIMKGWRVCLMCAQFRLMYPDMDIWKVVEADKVEGEDGVTLEQVYGESRDWHWG